MKRFPTSPGRQTPRGPKRQRGVASMLAAFWLLVAVVALGAIDVGSVFYQRRVLQSVADMAANAGAQVVDNACSRAPTTALGSAGANGFNASASGNSITTTCGRWDPTLYAGPNYYAANATPSNAVQVTVSKQVPYFFLGAGQLVSATGLAQAVNVGAFTIGTTTANVDPTVITGLLNALLGTNINTAQISALGYAGLAQSRIKIGDLVTAAGVGTVSQLLAMNVTAAQFVNLMVTALQNTRVANANLSLALGALQAFASANIPSSQTFPIGAVNGATGLLQVSLADTQSALTATISPLDALFVAADIAQAGKSAVNVSTGLNLGVATATLQVQVIQPPVLAIGEAGQTPAGAWRTSATTAQVRAFLKVTLGGLPGLQLGLLGLLSPPIVILPINVYVGTGTAWLVSTQCLSTQSASNSVVGVQTGIANVCIGETPTNLSATAPYSCSPAKLVNVANIVTITMATSLPAVVKSASSLTFDGIVGNTDDYQTTNSNQVGGVLYNATSSFATQLSAGNGLTLNVLGASLPISSPVGQALLSFVLPLLTPVFNALDTVLMPVLQLLGAQIGVSTVHDLSLACGQSQLQY
ncbi:TadG family pilus assembly protein [Caballeronia sordidicola]|jgi:uncharacterized membrane protein|uniref:TadG family pilus assembly protein n=1 Tax=Caballeronia sordidicola TaxID=196367 RepID=UPI000B79135B|nr:TadG family pilus assembly protein [Caballeronia sordidicola]